MGRGAWWAAVYGGHKELDMTERLTLSFKALHFERRSGLSNEGVLHSRDT